MRITLRQIETFYWIAKLGSIHAAANHLNFSQPALSSRVKELEGAMDMVKVLFHPLGCSLSGRLIG